nr:MAG TPA: hypothetical protein [Caudoviricetes sp.]
MKNKLNNRLIVQPLGNKRLILFSYFLGVLSRVVTLRLFITYVTTD